MVFVEWFATAALNARGVLSSFWHPPRRHVLTSCRVAALGVAWSTSSLPAHASPPEAAADVLSPHAFQPSRALTRASAESGCPDLEAPDATWIGEPLNIGAHEDYQFCRYELFDQNRRPSPIVSSSLQALQRSLALKGPRGLAIDDLVQVGTPLVMPLGTGLPEHANPLQLRAERVFQLVGRANLANKDAERVRVAVIDTEAEPYVQGACTTAQACGGAESDAPRHGRAMSRIIGSLLCAEADSCPSIRNYLALSSHVGPETVFGTLDDLAAAINRAVDDWVLQSAASRPRLIINLSVGWHPAQEFTKVPSLSEWEELTTNPLLRALHAGSMEKGLGRRAVRAAIERARCAGALVLAAAGNAAGEDRKGPLYPAAWESEPLPTAEACALFGDDVGPRSATAEPLVYAVSAVEDYGRPLPNTREPMTSGFGGLAPRAALGYAVTVPELHGGYTPIYSGTSVATAIASAVAAATWSHDPDLNTSKLVALLPGWGQTAQPPNLCLDQGSGCGASFQVVSMHGSRFEIKEKSSDALPSSDQASQDPRTSLLKERIEQTLTPCETSSNTATCVTEALPTSGVDPSNPFSVYSQPGAPACPDCKVHWRAGEDPVIYLSRMAVNALPLQTKVFTGTQLLGLSTTYDLSNAVEGDLIRLAGPRLRTVPMVVLTSLVQVAGVNVQAEELLPVVTD